MIAALFVERGGVYYGLPDVDPWDEERDARRYAGPWPVVAHPPCERWGKFWYGGPSARARRIKGDDGGCFAAALSAVRRFGGVLEHPADSAAWDAFGLMKPCRAGGWIVADWLGGWTCYVEQGHYGHRTRKPTWLYACRVGLPTLCWGRSRGEVVATTKRTGQVAMLSRAERRKTPEPFRDLLLSIASHARVEIVVTA